jgi:hypothetical protein
VTQLAAQLINLVGWVESWDDLGPIVFTGIIAVAIVFCLPCTIFEIIPGQLAQRRSHAILLSCCWCGRPRPSACPFLPLFFKRALFSVLSELDSLTLSSPLRAYASLLIRTVSSCAFAATRLHCSLSRSSTSAIV